MADENFVSALETGDLDAVRYWLKSFDVLGAAVNGCHCWWIMRYIHIFALASL